MKSSKKWQMWLGLAVLLQASTAYAEVLDKFGGCKHPSIYAHLLILIPLCVCLVLFAKKAKLLGMALAVIYSFGWLLKFIMFVSVTFFKEPNVFTDIFMDSARHGYYIEISECPQYEILGYWPQVSLAIALLLTSVFSAQVFRNRSR